MNPPPQPQRAALVLAAMLAGTLPAQAQSVVNWPTAPVPPATAAAPALPPSIPVLNPATASVPPPAQPPSAALASAPTPSAPLPPLQAGYVERSGVEPEIRLDVGRVSPELLARYAQQPGESQGAYIMRMNALYQQTQAKLEATEARNQAYLRSLAARPAPTPATTAAGQP